MTGQQQTDRGWGAAAPFDFDDWAQLARTDPAAFEARRSSAIEGVIRSAPEGRQRRLRGLQFRVDMECRRARTPLAACIKLSQMMWDSILGEDGLQERIEQLRATTLGIAGNTSDGPATERGRRTAVILDLRPRLPVRV